LLRQCKFRATEIRSINVPRERAGPAHGYGTTLRAGAGLPCVRVRGYPTYEYFLHT
jgi:hypothetical protein